MFYAPKVGQIKRTQWIIIFPLVVFLSLIFSFLYFSLRNISFLFNNLQDVVSEIATKSFGQNIKIEKVVIQPFRGKIMLKNIAVEGVKPGLPPLAKIDKMWITLKLPVLVAKKDFTQSIKEVKIRRLSFFISCDEKGRWSIPRPRPVKPPTGIPPSFPIYIENLEGELRDDFFSKRDWRFEGMGQIFLRKRTSSILTQGKLNGASFVIRMENSPESFWARFSLESLDFSLPYGSGRVSANAFLCKTVRSFRWEAQASLRNASLRHKSLPIEIANCSLNFLGNQDVCEIDQFNLQTLKGLQVKLGKIILSLRKPYLFSAQGYFEGTTTALSRLLERMGSRENPLGVANFPIKGKIRTMGQFSAPIIEASIELPRVFYKGLNINDNKLEIIYFKDKLEIKEGLGEMGKGRITYRGMVDLKDMKYLFAGKGEGIELERLPWSLKNELREKFKLKEFPEGGIKEIQFAVGGQGRTSPILELNGELTQFKYVKFYEKNLYINLSFAKGILNVDRLLASDETGTFAFQGKIDTKNGGVEGEIEGMDVKLGEIACLFGEDRLKGVAYLRGNIQGTVSNPVLRGGVEIFGGGLGEYGADYLICQFNADGKRIELPKIKWVKGIGEGWAQGEVDLSKKLISIKGEGENIFLSQLMPNDLLQGGIGAGNFEINGPLASPRFVANFKVRDFQVENMYLKSMEGTLHWEEGRMLVENGKLILPRGEVGFEGQLASGGIELSILGKLSLEDFPLPLGVSGYVSLKGKVAGTLRNPYFEGELEGNPVYRGEIGELKTSCMITKEGLEATNLTYEIGGGKLSASVYYDFKERGLNGIVKGENIPVSLAEKIAKIKSIPSLQGKLTTNLVIGGNLENPSIKGIFKLQNIGNQGVFLSSVTGDYSLDKNRLVVENVMASEKEMTINCGCRLDLAEKNFSLKVKATKIPLSYFALLTPSLKASGVGDLTLTGEGSLGSPAIQGSFNSKEVQINGEKINDLSLKGEFSSGNLRVGDISFWRDGKEIKGEALIPWDMKKGLKRDSPLLLSFNWEGQAISFLERFIPNLKELKGETTGVVHIEGTYDNPKLSGFINLQDGYMKPNGFEEGLKNMSAKLILEENKAVIEKATFQLGNGEGEFRGSIGMGKAGLVLGITADLKDITLKETNISGYGERFEGKLNGTVNIMGEFMKPLIFGRLTLSNSRLDFSSYILPEKEGEIGRRFFNPSFLLDISIGSNFWCIFAGSRILTEGRMGLTGTLKNPIAQGHFASRSGLLLISNYLFRLHEGSADLFYGFHRLSLNIVAQARTRVRGYDITANISGPYDDLQLRFSSSPPLPQRAILAMFVPEEFGENPEKFLRRELTNAFALGIETKLLAPLEFSLAEAMGLEEISLEYGLEGFPILRVRQQILPDTYIAYSRWLATPRERYIFSIERRLKGDIFLTFSTDELKRKIWGIEGSLRF
ncbi:MAG: translocation/assembly module TamB domain-containing protein [bacterium]